MVLVPLFLYLALTYLRPFDLYPELMPLHLTQIGAAICLVQTVIYIPFSPVTFRAKQVYLIVMFWFLLVTSMLLAVRWFGGALLVFEEFGITVLVFFVIVVILSTLGRLHRTMITLGVLSVLLAIQSIAAIHLHYKAEILILPERIANGAILERVRGTGFMTDPNDLSQTLVMGFPFLAVGWRKHHLLRNTLGVLFPMALLLYAVFLSHSRGAMLSLLVMLLVAASRNIGRILGGVITAGGVFGALAVNFAGGRALSGSDASATNRVEYWSAGLQMLKMHPFVGVGYQEFPSMNFGRSAHNAFVLCFGELGFPAFIVWVALLLIAIIELRSIRKFAIENEADEDLQRIAGAIELAMYGFLVSAWFLSRTYVVTLYILLALSAAAGDIARRGGKPLKSLSFLKLGRLSVMTSIGLIIFIYATIKFSIR